MPENLYLRLSRNPRSHTCDGVEWLLLDETTGIVRARGEGDRAAFEAEIGNVGASGDVHVMLSTDLCLLTRATVPGRQQRQVLQAIPYMVEDQLATEVEQCHFATSPEGGADYAVAVVDKALMADVFQWLTAGVGLSVATLTPDSLHQPDWPGALVQGGRCWVRTAENGGVLADVSLLPMLFRDVLAMNDVDEDEGEPSESGESPDHRVTITARSAEQDAIGMITSQLAAESVQVESGSTEYSTFEYLCRHFNPDAINLLQGEYKVKRASSSRGVRWQTLAGLAACAFVFNVVMLLVQGMYLDIKARQYEAEAISLYRSVFPDARSVSGIGTRWEAHLRGGTADTAQSFMAVFSQAARHVPVSDMQLVSVNFNASRGDLIMQLHAPRNEQFVALAQTLSQEGLQADIGSLSQDEGLVKGNIKIRIDG